MSDKTEEPTPKRLRKAREEGDSGQSQALSQALSFLVGTSAVGLALHAALLAVLPLLRAAFQAAAEPSPRAAFDPLRLILSVVAAPLPLLLTVGLVAAVVSFVQTGGFLATKKLAPKLDHLNVFNGLKGLVAPQRMFSVLRAALTAAVVGYLAFDLLRAHVADVVRLVDSPQHLPTLVERLGTALLKRAALVALGLGVVDAVVVHRSWKKRLRMGKDEVKREHKESDGDPQLKSERERLHQEMLAEATVGNVKRASVVVVNPTHIACALRYDAEGGDEAPILVARGEGHLARRILDAARAYGVPVLRDVPLARALHALEIGEEIPEALYEAVALVLRDAQAERDAEGESEG